MKMGAGFGGAVTMKTPQVQSGKRDIFMSMDATGPTYLKVSQSPSPSQNSSTLKRFSPLKARLSPYSSSKKNKENAKKSPGITLNKIHC